MSFVENVGRREILHSGEIGAFIDPGTQSLNGYERNALYKNLGPTSGALPVFFDVGYLEAADRIEDGRSSVVTDLDRDGDLDLVLQSMEQPVVVLVNQAPANGNWLQVSLQGITSNRDAIGARVHIEADGQRQYRELTSATGYLSGPSLVSHFGLGRASKVDRLIVEWPSGHFTERRDVPANQRIRILEDVALPSGSTPGGL